MYLFDFLIIFMLGSFYVRYELVFESMQKHRKREKNNFFKGTQEEIIV